jgi:LCP family protein required for cell wall assembly
MWRPDAHGVHTEVQESRREKREAQESEERRARLWRWALISALLALAVVGGAATGFAVLGVSSSTGGTNPITEIVGGDGAPGVFVSREPQYLLFLGADDEMNEPDQASRSDTIILIRIANEGISMLSIPRDTRVYIPGYGMDKINHAFAYGGPELTMETVSEFTGVEVNDYAIANFTGVHDVVEAMGGVRVNVPTEVEKRARPDGPMIRLESGPQKLDGDQALAYLRWRADSQGDIGRVKRQQEFLFRVFDQAFSRENLDRYAEVQEAALENVETNMSRNELIALGTRVKMLKDEENRVQLEAETVPGEEQTIYSTLAGTNLSFWVPDEEALEEVLRDTVRPPEGEDPATAGS